MLAKFWDKLAEGLAGAWNARMLTPAALFWSAGLLAWSWEAGWQPLTDLVSQTDAGVGIATAVAGVMILVASTAVAQAVTLPLLRLAEGYWPALLAPLWTFLVKRLDSRLRSKEERWEQLARKYEADRLSAREARDYGRLDAELAQYPLNPNLRMPTRLGNLLRAAEEYPGVRYGLDISVIWPRLWLVLPEETRKEIGATRQALDERVQILFWGLLFSVWSLWTGLALAVTLLTVLLAYRAMLAAAGVYGELLRAAFDLHRFALYGALHWPVPETPVTESEHGTRLTQYLQRGEAPPEIRFEFSDAESN